MKYFPDSHFLKFAKDHDSGFLWSGIWSKKKAFISDYKRVVGDGNDIVIVKYLWLRRKNDFTC